jgi:hypothetical protein
MTIAVRAANPIWYMVDHVGLSLNDEYYAFFLTNTLPYIPQNVYRDNLMQTVWTGNIVQFQPSGTMPNNLYFDPSLVYRIEIRHGNTQADELIWEINDFVPDSSGNSNLVSDFIDQDNQISNPQFAFVNFETPLTYSQILSSTYTVPVAPDWDLILTGTGTTTLSQLDISGTDSSGTPIIRGNPPYALRVNNNGWTSAVLRQRFNDNGAIYANGSIAMSITARAITNPAIVTLNYVPSSPGSPSEIISDTIPVGVFSILSNAIDLTSSTNSNTGDAAYVDIEIELPGTGVVDITNVQVIGDSTPLSDGFNPSTDIPLFREQTIERETDYLFHYYKPQLEYKPIPSHLVGWDFPLNPAQLGSSVAAKAVGANKSYYAWDQTILFQSANSGITTARNADGSGSLSLTAAVDGQIAIIQYLEQSVARKVLNQRMAVNLSLTTSKNGGLGGTVSLYYTKDAALPDMNSNNSLVLSLDANGKPATFAAGKTWYEVPRFTTNIPAVAPNTTHGQDASFTAPNSSNTSFPSLSINGWDMNGDADALAATYFAIVVGFAPMTAADQLAINSIALMSGDIATLPAPQTPDEVLRECQYYYEQSYEIGTAPATVTTTGQLTSLVPLLDDGINSSLRRNPFGLIYKVIKRAVPATTFYSPAFATPNYVQMSLNTGITPTGAGSPVNVIATDWTRTGASRAGVNMVNNATNEVSSLAFSSQSTGVLNFHYTSDARLGII